MCLEVKIESKLATLEAHAGVRPPFEFQGRKGGQAGQKRRAGRAEKEGRLVTMDSTRGCQNDDH